MKQDRQAKVYSKSTEVNKENSNPNNPSPIDDKPTKKKDSFTFKLASKKRESKIESLKPEITLLPSPREETSLKFSKQELQ